MPRPAAERADAADRFSASLAALIGTEGLARDRFGLAVSGGPDSLGLLLLAARALPGRIAAATVDHRLRPEAADEAALVARLCAKLDVPHSTLTAPAPPDPPNQAGARALRYRLLGEWRAAAGIDWLLTAHHADDQLETLLLRLGRASGVGGLAGIRARNGAVLRPLLDWRRADLAALVSDAGWTAVDDPSNRNARFDRARLRLRIGDDPPVDPQRAAASARQLAEADAALDWTVRQLAGERLTAADAAVTLDPADLPAELLRRLVLAAMRLIDADAAPRGDDLNRMIAALHAGRAATLGRVKACPCGTAAPNWRFTEAPPRRSA